MLRNQIHLISGNMGRGRAYHVPGIAVVVLVLYHLRLVTSAALHDHEKIVSNVEPSVAIKGLQYDADRDGKSAAEGNTTAERDKRSLASILAGMDESKPDNSYLFNVGLRQDSLLQHCGDGEQMKLSFPNLDYAFLGYDIVKGYPLAMGSDPGFTYPIFFADYSQNLHTSDCRYSVPRGLVVIPDVSCDVSFTSKVIKNMRAFEKELAKSASVRAGGFGFQFSASTSYKEAASTLSKGEYSYVVSTAACNYYKSKINDIGNPGFDEYFLTWVRNLSVTDSDADYFAFFDRYGTHYPTRITFGARYCQQHKINTKVLETMESKNVSVEVSASYSGLFSVGGGYSFSSSQRQQASDFSENTETKTTTVGAAPPSNGDAMTWASSVQQNPVPISYELDNIENLFTEKFMKNLGVDFQRIHKNIKDKVSLYVDITRNEAGGDGDDRSVFIPGWYVRGNYEEQALSFRDCYEICKGLGAQCTGVSYCKDCGSLGNSKCSMFNSDVDAADWTYNKEWQTVMTSGPIILSGFAVADGTQHILVSVTRQVTSSPNDDFQNLQSTCLTKFNENRSGNTVRAVAYSIGFVFGESFVFCRVHGTRKVLTLERRRYFDTFINP